MPNWYYDLTELKSTPSIAGGMEYSTEQRYRKEGARFIFNVGTRMGLRNDTLATGVVYFHRFYMFHSFTTFPRFVTACCCLFLAGKVEETPKKCKDIIKTARLHLTARQFSQFGDDPKEEVMTLERILLQTIKFDLQVDHPYKYLLRYAKSLKGDKEKLQEMVQMAWTFINDSLCTTLCLQWEPEIIGIALMYLAGKLTKFEIIDWDGRTPKHKYWWDMFVENLNTDFLEGICHQFLDFYGFQSPVTPQDSPSNTPTKRVKKSHSSSRRNSGELTKSPGKLKSRTSIKDTPVSNSESVPPAISSSPPPPPPDRDAPSNPKVSATTLPKHNSSMSNDATNVTPATSEPIISTTVLVNNAHSSAIQNVSNVDILHKQNYTQGMGQMLGNDQAQPIVYEGQQTTTVPVAQTIPQILVPPPLFNSQHINIYPPQCTVGEKLGNHLSNPYFPNGTSSFNGQFPHLNYHHPPPQFYQRPDHQEHYYNNIPQTSNHQSTYIPPAQCPVVPSLPVGQTLPPLQHPPPLRPLPHLISVPPPPVRHPIQDHFVSQPSQGHIRYQPSRHSPTMPFPLHQKQISSNNVNFTTPGKGIRQILPAENVYRYRTDAHTQNAQHLHLQDSTVKHSIQKF